MVPMQISCATTGSALRFQEFTLVMSLPNHHSKTAVVKYFIHIFTQKPRSLYSLFGKFYLVYDDEKTDNSAIARDINRF